MRRVRLVAALTFIGALAACGKDPFGEPIRPTTHGYRAHLSVRDAHVTTEGEVAVRGDDFRFEPSGKETQALIVKAAEKKLLEIDPRTKTWSEASLPEPWPILSGYPLKPGFDDHAEAQRRGIDSYHRESDSVLAGHVCWIWRFEDRPDDPASPSTTYWVATDLDRLVVRVDRETPKPDGTRERHTTEFTNVRVGADPELFQPPKGYSKTAAPPTTKVAAP